MPDRTVLDAYAARIIAALRDPMKLESTARESTGRRSVAPVERSVALATYKESGKMKPGRSRVPVTGGARRASSAPASVINAREGAHGELLPEPSSNTDERG